MISVLDVKEAYRVVLGREIESETTAAALAAQMPDKAGLLRHLLWSDEFQLHRGPLIERFAVADPADTRLFMSLGRYAGTGTPGFVTDFLGTKTDVGFVSAIGHLSGHVEGYPLPRGNFHGDLTEWIGTLISVLDASDSVTVVELGAGWAPWLAVSARVAAKHNVGKVRLLGLEGSSAHAHFMRRHFENNRIPLDGNRLVHGIAGPHDGSAEFPVADDPSADWGQAAFFGEQAGDKTRSDYRGFSITKTETVPVYSVDSFLADEKLVNLMHIDIQGAEVDVVSAGLDTLSKKVKAMVIGTHTRQIEGAMASALTVAGWTLCREQACTFSLGTSGVSYLADGCQFWRNQRFFGRV